MKSSLQLVGLVIIAGLLAAPSTAFTLNSIDIAINQDGGANITATYNLTVIERVAVLVRVAQPEIAFGSALEQYTGKDVRVVSVESGMTQLTMENFSTVIETFSSTVYTTPALDFSGAKAAIKRYWFSRFVTVDASYDTAVVRFPDGYEVNYLDSSVIPATTHEVTKGKS